MNRRQFTQSLAAIAAAPALPAPFAKVAVAATRPLSQTQHPYNWAAFIARVHNKASPDMFRRQLALSDEMAHQVYNVLRAENVITAPDALGVSKTISPFQRADMTMWNHKHPFGQQAHAQAKAAEHAPSEAQDTHQRAARTDLTETEEDETTPEPDQDSETINQKLTASEHDPAMHDDSARRPSDIDAGPDQLD